MSNLLRDLGENVKALSSNWSGFSVAGSVFVLYVLGYLCLRFHLTVLGVGTDLEVLDERYLFTGAKFFVYLFTTIPSVVLIFLLLAAVFLLPYRILPRAIRDKIDFTFKKVVNWLNQSNRLLWIGILFSVFTIQFVMRDCFELTNLFLASSLPANSFLNLSEWLLYDDQTKISLFFVGLVTGCGLSLLILINSYTKVRENDLFIWFRFLLTLLVVVQLLLLPINYGCLVEDKLMPRVASLDGVSPLPNKTHAWLVWEGKEGMTYLIYKRIGNEAKKSLITLPRKEIKKLELTSYDNVLPILFPEQSKKIL